MSAEDKSKLSSLNTNMVGTAYYQTVEEWISAVKEAPGNLGDSVVGYCEKVLSSYLTDEAFQYAGKLIMVWRGKNMVDYLIWGNKYLYTGRYEGGVLSDITEH